MTAKVFAADVLRYLGALATFVVGAVHLQQYADFISDVPTIGVLFLLTASVRASSRFCWLPGALRWARWARSRCPPARSSRSRSR